MSPVLWCIGRVHTDSHSLIDWSNQDKSYNLQTDLQWVNYVPVLFSHWISSTIISKSSIFAVTESRTDYTYFCLKHFTKLHVRGRRHICNLALNTLFYQKPPRSSGTGRFITCICIFTVQESITVIDTLQIIILVENINWT